MPRSILPAPARAPAPALGSPRMQRMALRFKGLIGRAPVGNLYLQCPYAVYGAWNTIIKEGAVRYHRGKMQIEIEHVHHPFSNMSERTLANRFATLARGALGTRLVRARHIRVIIV